MKVYAGLGHTPRSLIQHSSRRFKGTCFSYFICLYTQLAANTPVHSFLPALFYRGLDLKENYDTTQGQSHRVLPSAQRTARFLDDQAE